VEQIKKSDKHLIFKKSSGRYAVKDSKTKQWINGDAKADILVAEALITGSQPKPAAAEAETSAETPAESETATEAAPDSQS
jgi:hypothetical protein